MDHTGTASIIEPSDPPDQEWSITIHGRGPGFPPGTDDLLVELVDEGHTISEFVVEVDPPPLLVFDFSSISNADRDRFLHAYDRSTNSTADDGQQYVDHGPTGSRLRFAAARGVHPGAGRFD